MATIYEVEIVSHWTSYTNEELQKLLERAIKKDKQLTKYKNEITIHIKDTNKKLMRDDICMIPNCGKISSSYHVLCKDHK